MSSPEAAPPNHYTSSDDVAGKWSCVCGAGGSATSRDDASTLAYQHRDQSSDLVARSMTPDQLAGALRIGATDSQRQAAVELLIANQWWLAEESLRPYIFCRWEHLGSMAAFIDWRQLAQGLLLVDRAIKVLRTARAPENLVDEIDEWDTTQAQQRNNQGKGLDGSSSELAMLRIATSIASAMPINIGDDTSSLDNDNRGLVLTAIGHLLNHGGNVPFWSALTWEQFYDGKVH